MLQLGSALGPDARVEGLGSNGPARAESGGPSTAAGWGRRLAYRWLSGLTASCREIRRVRQRARTHAQFRLNPEGSGLAVGRLRQSLEVRTYGPGSGHWLMLHGGGMESLRELSRRPRNDQPWLPTAP